MNVRSFLDSNILVYTDDQRAPDKRSIATDLVRAGVRSRKAVLSNQVLSEYFVSATRKLGVTAEVARRKIVLLSRLNTVMLEVADVLSAIDLHRLHQIAYWDALILRAAARAGCKRVYSEDLQDRQVFGDVEIVNPFK